MRFDDRLATMLRQPAETDGARQAIWRQLVDLLAQAGERESSHREAVLDRLRAWRNAIPLAIRRSAAASLSGHILPADLIRFFAEDAPSIAAPVLTTASGSAEFWCALIPELSPVARALLRHRRDLEPEAVRALAAFGASDLVIPAPALVGAEAAATAPSPPPSPPAIAELVARIEAFRRRREEERESASVHNVAVATGEFRFETGPDGVVAWCDHPLRGAIVGISIAAAGVMGEGVDGHAAGAFRSRAAFRDARLSLAGEGGAGGEWRISAVPVFDEATGRFTGYRGTGRRPRIDERAELAGLYGTALPGDSLRQLAHEIRTPLNAIIGFAEMIDRQILGPAAEDYRERASLILGEARRLLGTIDDLDTAARLEAHVLKLDPRHVDGAAVLAGLADRLDELTRERGVTLRIEVRPELTPIDADPVSVERMFSRLLTATLGLAAEGEEIGATLGPRSDGVKSLVLRIARPEVLAGRDERALLDPGYSLDGEWPDAPVLGLGFTLRLVRGLAEAAHGLLLVEDEAFVLSLPCAKEVAHEPGESGRGPVG